MKRMLMASAVALASLTGTAQAITVLEDENGFVTGITNVNILDTLYTLDFSDNRRCVEIDAYTGCDEQSDFTIQDRDVALALAIRVLRTVFVGDRYLGLNAIEGLTRLGVHLYIPYDIAPSDTGDRVRVAIVDPFSRGFRFRDGLVSPQLLTVDEPDQRFVVVTNDGPAPVTTPSPVPLPAGAGLLLAALAGLAWFRRT